MKDQTIMVNIEDIKYPFFVRKELNQDHVLFLADQLENGAKLPPIILDKHLGCVIGRHRIEAHKVCLKTQIEAIILSDGNIQEHIFMAVKENNTGQLPMNRGDFEFTIEKLLSEGVSRRAIITGLPIDKELTRKYIGHVLTKLKKKTAVKVRNMVENGNGSAEISRILNIPEKEVKEFIKSEMKQKKEGEENEELVRISGISGGLASSFGKFNKSLGKIVGQLFQSYSDGVATKDQVKAILANLGKLVGHQVGLMRNWENRFNDLSKTIDGKPMFMLGETKK